jgi:hypothetical protein
MQIWRWMDPTASTDVTNFLRSCTSFSYWRIYQHFWNPRVHCRVHKSPQLVPILSQINQDHTTSSKIHFNIILPPTSKSSQWSPSFWLPHQNPTCIPLPHACYMPYPSLTTYVLILGEVCKLWSSSLCSFLQPPTISDTAVKIKMYLPEIKPWSP